MIRPTLETYIAESGQWAGIIRHEGEEVARIAGCETLDDVLAGAVEQWPDVEHVDLPDALPGLWRERGGLSELVRLSEPAITPGMVAQTEIITGDRSILGYLMKPVLRAKERALTER